MTAPEREARARLEAVISGRVQGVGYRFFAARVASALGLDGWVANEPDGTVRCVVEGRASELEAFLAQLRDGPPSAFVSTVRTTWSAPRGEGPGFSVRSGWHRGD